MRIKFLPSISFFLICGIIIFLLIPSNRLMYEMHDKANDKESAKEFLAAYCAEKPQDYEYRLKYLTLLDVLADSAELVELQKAKKDFPESLEARELLIKYFQDVNMPEMVAQEIDELLALLFEKPEKRRNFKSLYQQQLEYYRFFQDQAGEERLLEKLVKNFSDEDSYLLWFDFLHRHQRFAELKAETDKYIEKGENSSKMTYQLAWYKLIEEDFDTVQQIITEGLERFPKNQNLYHLKDQALYLQAVKNGSKEAIKNYIFTSLKMESPYFQSDYSLLMSLALQNNLLEGAAITAHKWAALSSVKNFQVVTIYNNMDIYIDDPAKIDVLKKFYNKFKSNEGLTQVHANMLTENRMFTDALPLWKELADSQADLDIHLTYLECLNVLESPEFESAMNKARQLFPDNLKIIAIAAYHATKTKNYPEAKKLWSFLVSKQKDEVQYHLNYINTLEELKDKEELLAYWLSNKDLFPQDEAYSAALAYTLQNIELWSEAAEKWSLVIKLNPQNTDAVINELYCLEKAKDPSLLAVIKNRIKHYPKEGVQLSAVSLLMDLKEYSTAKNIYSELLQKSPDNKTYRINLLACLYSLNEEKAYLKELETFVKRYPDDDKQRLELAYIYHNNKNWPAAIPQWLKLLETDNDFTLWENLLFALNESKHEDYRLYLLKALALFADDQEKQLSLASQISGVDKNEALQIYLKILETDKDNIKILRLMLPLISQNDPYFVKIISALEKIDFTSLSIEERMLLIDHFVASGENEKADRSFRQSLKDFPKNINLKISWAYFLADNKKYAEAVPVFDYLYKNTKEKDEMGRMLLFTAREAQDPEKLKEIVSALYAENPANAEYAFILAAILRESEPETSQKILDKFVTQALTENKPEVLNLRSKELLEQQFNKQAETLVDALLRLEPMHQDGLRRKANILSWNNQSEKAEPYLRKYLKLVPDDAEALRELASILQLRGKLDLSAAKEANDLYQRVLELLDAGWKKGNLTMLRARALSGVGRIEEAIPYFEILIKESPEDGFLFGDFAESLIDAKMYAKAETVLDQAPKFGLSRLRNQRLYSRLYMEQEEYEKALVVLKQINSEYPDDVGVILEMAYCLTLTENQYEAIKVYKSAISKSENKKDDSTLILKQELINLQRLYGDRVGVEFLNIGYGKTVYDKTSLTYSSFLNKEFQLEGSIDDYFLRGPGIPGEDDAREHLKTFINDLHFRPGKHWKLTLGHIYNKNHKDDWHGFHLAAEKKIGDLSLNADYKHRQSWYDPVSVAEHSGSMNVFSLSAAYRINERISISQKFSRDTLYLLDPPGGGGKDVYKRWQSYSEVNFKIYDVPEVVLYYQYHWSQADTESFYQDKIFLEDKRRTHYVGVRVFYQVNPVLQVFGSLSLARDAERRINFSPHDFMSYSVGFNWRVCENWDILGNYFESTESLIGQQGTYREIGIKLVYNF